MKNIAKIIIMSAAMLSFAACDNEPDIWETNTKDINGSWVVAVTENNFQDTLLTYEDACYVYIYNTNDNDNNVWIVDDALVGFKIKATTNMENLTFQSDDNFITNGKVVKKGAHVQPPALMGNPITADSIYFEVKGVDYDDDGTLHDVVFFGYRHTGWEEER